MRRTSSWLWVLGACAVPAACTFGADDFKVVSATDNPNAGSSGKTNNSAGDGSSNGGDTSAAGAGNSSGGASGMAGEMGGAVGGAGGDSGVPQLSCSIRSPAAELFTSAELVGSDNKARNLDSFFLISGVADAGFAIATGQGVVVGGMGSGDSIIVVRQISDSNQNAVGDFTSTVTQGYFKYAGAYRDMTAVHVIGADNSGVIDVKFDLTANRFAGTSTISPLETPAACMPLTNGNVRDIHAAFDGELTYAVTCADQGDMVHTLHVRTGPGTIDQVPDMGLDPSRIVRQYVHSKDGTMLLLTGDEFGPSVDVRYGKTAAQLATRHAFVVQKDDTLSRGVSILPLADYSGAFVSAFLVHFAKDNPMTPVPPITLLGGTFKVADYPTLSDVPPQLLGETAVYDSLSDDVLLPNDGNLRISGDAFLVGSGPKNDSISTWVVDAQGRPRSDVIMVHTPVKNVTTDDPRGALLGLSEAIAWRQVEADGVTVKVMLRTIACL